MVPTWPHNNSTDLYNFRFVLVCFSVLEILAQASEKHIQTQFSLWQFRFWSITQPEMLCHVSMCYLPTTELGIRFQ